MILACGPHWTDWVVCGILAAVITLPVVGFIYGFNDTVNVEKLQKELREEGERELQQYREKHQRKMEQLGLGQLVTN